MVRDAATAYIPRRSVISYPHGAAHGGKYPKCDLPLRRLWPKASTQKKPALFGYIDECQYLNGVVGFHEQSKKSASSAAKPIPQVLRNCNPFCSARAASIPRSLPVDRTGDWSAAGQEAEATNSMVARCDVIHLSRRQPKVIVETAEKRGISSCGYHASCTLAPKVTSPARKWNCHVYTAHVKDAQEGKPFKNLCGGA